MKRKSAPLGRILFVTGTDTGVGKTLLTALLLQHLRDSGVHALAMKPFCSGGAEDVDLIQAIQGPIPSRDEVNPFYFAHPVAPLVAARMEGRRISLDATLESIRWMQRQCEFLIIEGAGGLLVPLGEKFTVADLIARLRCETLIVARNKLGVINHTFLTVEALRTRRIDQVKIVLMGESRSDISVKTNLQILRKSAVNIGVFELPYLGRKASHLASIKKSIKKFKKVLVHISQSDIVCPVDWNAVRKKPLRKTGLKNKKVC